MQESQLKDDAALEEKVLRQIKHWEKPSDSDIATILGEDCIDVFNYVYLIFRHKKRVDCDNPAMAHFYDVARYVKRYLDKSQSSPSKNRGRYMKCALLHDVPEDASESIEQLEERVDDIRKRFGIQTANDVMLMTNIYSFIIDIAIKRMNGEEDEKKALIDAVDSVNRGLKGEDLRRKYNGYFNKIKKIIEDADISEVGKLKKENELFTFTDYIKFTCYKKCYINAMVDYSKVEFNSGNFDYDLPIAVKTADGFDSEETMPPSKSFGSGKIIKKAEIKIDVFGDFLLFVKKRGDNAGLSWLMDEMKYGLISNVEQRIKSTNELESHRYKEANMFFNDELKRLKLKYVVEPQQSFDFGRNEA